MYSLWLNGKKINDAGEIKSNYDADALCGYYLGGSLVKWLENQGGALLAEKVAAIDDNGDIDAQLAEIFGQKKPEPFICEKPEIINRICCLSDTSSFMSTSFSSVMEKGSFSLPITSFNGSISSFINSSFTGSIPFSGSFFVYGSFNFSFTGFTGYPLSSFHYKQLEEEKKAQEKIRANLSSSPLNCYGYGIHLI